MIVVEVMTQMILLQPQPNTLFHREMMDRKMDPVVTDVTECKSGGNGRARPAERFQEKTQKKECERNTDARRHYQPPRVTRIVVMHTVHDKMQFFSHSRRGLVMKSPAMNDVLQKRPDQHAKKKERNNSQDRQSIPSERQVKHVSDHRQINHQRRGRMHMGEKLHEIAFKHPHAFVFL